MRTIAGVFGRSPFIPLQEHMDKVAECVSMVPEAFEAYKRKDAEAVRKISEDLSKLEHEADQIKHEIQNNLPRGLFMPVDRSNLLRILTIQDSIANRAENIAVLLTFKFANSFEGFTEKFEEFVAKNLETFLGANKVIGQLDELLETGFGGAEASAVRTMINEVALFEHEVDVLQHDLLRDLLAHESEISYGDFFLWTRLIQQVAEISNRSDNLTAAVKTTLEAN